MICVPSNSGCRPVNSKRWLDGLDGVDDIVTIVTK